MCLLGVTVLYCLILFDASHKLFRDSDSGWHIRTGERILDTLTLPHTDPYSFSRSGSTWFAWEWGSDVLMAAAHKVAGLNGVAWIYVMAIGVCSWLWVQLNWAAGGNFFLASAFAAPMLSSTNLHWLARPHVFGWVFLLSFVWYFEKAPDRFRWRDAVSIACGATLWANLHASFFLLPVIAAIYAIGHLVRAFVWEVDTAVELAKARWFGLAGGLAALACVFNPYGWAMPAHVIRYLGDGELLDRVAEFQSFNFHVAGSLQILSMLGIAALGGVLALERRNVAHFLLTALFLAVALRSARGLPVAALLLLPLANGAITAALRRAREMRPGLAWRLTSFLDYSDRLRVIDGRLSGLALIPLIALLVFVWPVRAEFPKDDFPVAAAGRLPASLSGVRILAPDKFGGYLIYRFDGRLKVFFDGRSDFYGSGFMKDYIRLVEVRPGWREQLDKWGFTHALLPVNYSLGPALSGIGWKEFYRDDVAVLLER